MRGHARATALDDVVCRLAAGGVALLYDRAADSGDLIATADRVDPGVVNFLLIESGGGLLNVALPARRHRELGLSAMRGRGGAHPALVEAASGVTTGISAADRARTIGVLGAPESRPGDLISPGHIGPLVAHDRGLLGRVGRREAAVGIVRLATGSPVAVLSEVLTAGGAVARRPDLLRLAELHGLPLVELSEVTAWFHGAHPEALPVPTFIP